MEKSRWDKKQDNGKGTANTPDSQGDRRENENGNKHHDAAILATVAEAGIVKTIDIEGCCQGDWGTKD